MFKVLRVRLDRGPDLVEDIPADGRGFGLDYFSRSFQPTPFCGCPSSFPYHLVRGTQKSLSQGHWLTWEQ